MKPTRAIEMVDGATLAVSANVAYVKVVGQCGRKYRMTFEDWARFRAEVNAVIREAKKRDKARNE